MKKIIASTLGLMMFSGVAVTGAMAAESQFGGMWRTRMIFSDNMTGSGAGENADGTTFAANNDSGSNYITDTRTRLYYTAKFSDNFKFVNRFEFDAKWGGPKSGYGDIATDGDSFELAQSYVDYTMGMLNAKIGAQPGTIARGFLFAENFAGITLTPDFGNVKMPIMYAAVSDEEAGGDVWVGGDVHLLSVMPQIKISDAMQLTPHVTYLSGTSDIDEDLWWIGADIDMKFDAVSAWGTFIYNTGEIVGEDVDAFLVAVGADAGLVHGQAFYATGDDSDFEGDVVSVDADAFVNPPGRSYYWSEIMGFGTFDNVASNGSPADGISNIWAANVGVTLKPMDKLTAKFDVWYAALAEENLNGDDELGIELDAMLTYKLEDNLNVDFIFAYLIAGDATGDEDVIESGVRLSLAF